MSDTTRLDFDSLPPVLPSYGKAAITLSGKLSKGETIPEIVAEVKDLEIRAENLARYRKVCGFDRTDALPVTYPHVLAFPMHMAVLTHKKFPLKLLGLVHVQNDITQHRAIGADEKLHVEVSVGGHEEKPKGIEFGLKTRVRDRSGELIWESTGTMLSIQKTDVPKPKRKNRKPGLEFEPEEEHSWQVPEDIGRRYAAVAGDYNPIHLNKWSAKLFGFKRHIATGMWTKARAAAALESQLEKPAHTLSIGFKKPVFLPSTTRFAFARSAQGIDFGLTSPDGDTVHLVGDVRYR